MKSFTTMVAMFAVSVIGAVLFTTGSASATGGSSSTCLDSAKLSSYDVVSMDRGKGTITTTNGKPLCNDSNLVFQSFNVPDAWRNSKDGLAKAWPQTQFARTEFVFPAGKSDYKMNVTVTVPDACKGVQMDFNLAPGMMSMNAIDDDAAINILGALFEAKGSCTIPVEPKTIDVCVLSDKSTKTIKETEFDSNLYSKNLDDCKKPVEPKTIDVCVLSDKSTKTIKETEFDSSKYSRDMNSCVVTPVTPPTVTPPVETPAPVVLPNTGAGSVITLAAVVTVVSGVAFHFIRSRRLAE